MINKPIELSVEWLPKVPLLSSDPTLLVKPPRSEERGILIWMAELSIAYSPPFHPP
jgi:hypothetical protein